MDAFTLTKVSDTKLLADLAALLATDRQTTAMLLAHIAEVDERKLWAPAACTSMHAYCTGVLHLSEDAAFKRIRAARAGRDYPQILVAVAEGRLHLTAVGLLAPHLTAANVDELIAAATHKSRVEIEMFLARLAPRPDLPTVITPIVPLAEPPSQFQLAPEPVAPSHDAPAAHDDRLARVAPLAPDRFGLQVTITQATRDKLERARALLRHAVPSGDVAEVLDRALDALLAQLEKTKFGATSRPRAGKARREGADPRHASNAVRREVHSRDGEQCSFVSETGMRCTERGFLELDHRDPVGRDGQPTVENMRYLCRAHNQYEAERIYGADFMRAKREVAAERRAKARRGDVAPTPAVATPAARAEREAPFDADAALALRGLGFAPAEIRHAMADTRDVVASTLEGRLRTALAALTRYRASRCSERPLRYGHRELRN